MAYNIPFLDEALRVDPLQFDFELNPEFLPPATNTRTIAGYEIPMIGELTVLEKWFFGYLDSLYLARAAAGTPKMEVLVNKFITAHPKRFKTAAEREYEKVATLLFSAEKDDEINAFRAEHLSELQEIGATFVRTTGEQLARISFFLASRVDADFNSKKLGYMSTEKLALLSAGVEDVIRLEEGKIPSVEGVEEEEKKEKVK